MLPGRSTPPRHETIELSPTQEVNVSYHQSIPCLAFLDERVGLRLLGEPVVSSNTSKRPPPIDNTSSALSLRLTFGRRRLQCAPAHVVSQMLNMATKAALDA